MKRTIGLVSLAAIISTGTFAEETTKAKTAPATSSDTAVATPAQPTATIDCNYIISGDTKKIDPTVITKWAENATLQSFDYDFNTIDGQLGKLKACFTDEGWTGFNDALKKSGNIEAIKSQHLAVSATATGTAAMQTIKENQWKLTLPVQVVYQNSEEKLTQKLTVDVLVGKKPSGSLGILQMIATPETPANTSTAPAATPEATTPATAPATTPATTNSNETAQPTTPAVTPSTTPAAETPTTDTATPTTPTAPVTPATPAEKPDTAAPATPEAASTPETTEKQ